MNTSIRRWAILALLVCTGALVVPGCTDLTEETFGVITPDQFYQNDQQIVAALAPIYAQLRETFWAYHNLSQVSSDETIVPTRGSDWFDNGRWLSMHKWTWDPSLTDLNDAWNASFIGVARANSLLQILDENAVDNPALEAEIRTLRAFYYYTLLDLFGNIPVVGDEPGEFSTDPDNPPGAESRATVYNFIVSELDAVRGDLPATQELTGRMTQGAADALLASLYINAEVFGGSVTESGLQRASPAWEAAEQAANRIITSGTYDLADDWFSIFNENNQDNPEHIFVVQHMPADGLGLTFAMRGLHYNQTSPSAWNGFATLASVYNSFDADDPRREIFLAGQQCFGSFTGETPEDCNQVLDRNGNPLVFTPDYPQGPEEASEGNGYRIMKFPPEDPASVGGNFGNDYAYFRLGEMYLIRAEARNEQGNVSGAIDDLNMVRDRVGLPDYDGQETQEAVREAIFQERLFELTYEARRRQDLVRAGMFASDWQFKERTDPYRVLFPVPQAQLDANPNLCQNAGYGGTTCAF